MVRENRIKTFKFPSQTISATTTGSLVSDNLNGEILDVFWSFNRAGSIFLTIAETGEEVFRRNVPSGTNIQLAHPRHFGESTTGSIANANQFGFVTADKVVLNLAGMASGTQVLDLSVRYR